MNFTLWNSQAWRARITSCPRRMALIYAAQEITLCDFLPQLGAARHSGAQPDTARELFFM